MGQMQKPAGVSFDHLIGNGEYARGYSEAERSCGLAVDDQLEFGRLLDGNEAGRLLAGRAAVELKVTMTSTLSSTSSSASSRS
jgi:hypothetical protein